MRGRRSPIVVELTDQQREDLEYIVRCPNKPAGLVRRARVVLLLARGCSFCEVQRQTGMRRKHAREWAKRFVWRGVEGLNEKPRPGRKPVFPPSSCNPSGESRLRTARPDGAIAQPMGLSGVEPAIGA
jgi:hypothetical protein